MTEFSKELMEDFDTIRKKYLGTARETLDKIWYLLIEQQCELNRCRFELAESRRENDIHTAALKAMRNYEFRARQKAAEEIFGFIMNSDENDCVLLRNNATFKKFREKWLSENLNGGEDL